MAGFQDVVRTSLGNGLLDRDPTLARGLFLRDLARTQQQRSTSRGQGLAAVQQQRDAATRELHSGRHGFGFLAPGAEQDRAWNPPAAKADQQTMLDAILRDQAVADYNQGVKRQRLADAFGR